MRCDSIPGGNNGKVSGGNLPRAGGLP